MVLKKRVIEKLDEIDKKLEEKGIGDKESLIIGVFLGLLPLIIFLLFQMFQNIGIYYV